MAVPWLLGFGLVALVPSASPFWNFYPNAELWPVDPYIETGDPIQLYCMLTDTYFDRYGSLLNASSVYFRILDDHNQQVPLSPEYHRIINSTTIELYIPNSTEQNKPYYCCINHTSIGGSEAQTLDLTEVVVINKPKAITEIACEADNLQSMTCSFCPQAETAVRYDIQWRMSRGTNIRNGTCWYTDVRQCACVFCSMAGNELCGGQHSEQTFFIYSSYTLTVTARRGKLEPVISDIEVHAGPSIVKPRLDPASVEVIPLNSTALSVSWDHPDALLTISLNYNVSYSSNWHPETLVRYLLDIDGGRQFVVLDDLHPDTLYNISLVATPSDDGIYTSDAINAQETTSIDAPASGPPLAIGSFRTIKFQGQVHRNVVFFWGKTDDTNGKIKFYNRTLMAPGALNVSVFFEASAYFQELTLDKEVTYTVSLSAYTVPDLRGPESLLNIPRHSSLIQAPFIEGELQENGQDVRFLIHPPEGIEISTYTLLRCKKSLDTTAEWSLGPASTVILPGNTTEYTVHNHHNHVYDVAVNTLETTSGLGPDWLCLYSYDKEPSTVEFVFSAEQEERSLTLEWTHPKCSVSNSGRLRGKIISYNIYVYSHYDTAPEASGYTRQATYTDDRISHVISCLLPYTPYNITLEVCTVVKCWSNHTLEQTTVASKASAPWKIAGVTLGSILGGFLLIASIIIFVRCTRNNTQNAPVQREVEYKELAPYTIMKTPGTEKPAVHETSNGLQRTPY